jgi:tRNA pseudouridine38-40 synthase
LKTRYFIYLSFKGTYYHGWQIQPNAVSVQQILEETLSLVVGEKITTTGAGRTDAGVHALVFCAHFDCSVPDLDSEKNLIFRLNRFLPCDISICSVRKVTPEANARFSAVSRTYRYFISKRKDPFSIGLSWFLYGNINVKAMEKAAGLLTKYSDFTSFSRLHSDNKTSICKIYNASWSDNDDKLIFTIKADRFLRNMVRAIVGTMVELGTGKISPGEFEKIILLKDRSKAGMSAPAGGLFLSDIEYPEDIFLNSGEKSIS